MGLTSLKGTCQTQGAVFPKFVSGMTSSHSDSCIDFSCFTGFAIVGQTGSALKSKTIFLDAKIFLGRKFCGLLLGSVQYFNNNDIDFCDFPGGLLCMVRTLVNLSLCQVVTS